MGRGQERRGHRPRWAQVSSLSLLRGVHPPSPACPRPARPGGPPSFYGEQAGCTEWAWGMCLWATGKSLQIGGQKRGADSQWGRPGLRRRPAACSEPRFPPLPLGSCTHASVPWLLPCEGPVALVTELSRGRGCGVGVLPVTLRLSQDGRAVSATLPRVSASRNYHREPQVSPVSDMVGALTGEGLGDGPLWQAGPGPEAAP